MTRCRHCLSGLTALAAAVVAATPLAIDANPAAALDEAYCSGYASKAVEQYIEYKHLGCQGGRSEWWSDDYEYHKGWCKLEPESSDLPAKGIEDRDKVLDNCGMVGIGQEEPPGIKPAKPDDFECPYVFGPYQFREDQIEGGIAGPDPNGTVRASCHYSLPEGTFRLYGVWIATGHLVPPGASFPGCARLTNAASYYEGSQGYEFRSYDMMAFAGISGDTQFVVDLIRKHSQGPVQNMFVLAELHAQTCPRR